MNTLIGLSLLARNCKASKPQTSVKVQIARTSGPCNARICEGRQSGINFAVVMFPHFGSQSVTVEFRSAHCAEVISTGEANAASMRTEGHWCLFMCGATRLPAKIPPGSLHPWMHPGTNWGEGASR